MLSSNMEPIIIATFLYYLPCISKMIQAAVLFTMFLTLRMIENVLYKLMIKVYYI